MVATVDPTARAFATRPIRALGLQEEEAMAFALEDPSQRARALLALSRKALSPRLGAQRSGLSPTGPRLADRSVASESRSGPRGGTRYTCQSEAISALLEGDAIGVASPARAIAVAGTHPFVLSQTGGALLVDLPDGQGWRSRADALLAAGDALREPYAGLSGSLLRFKALVEEMIQGDDSSGLEFLVTLGELLIAAEADRARNQRSTD